MYCYYFLFISRRWKLFTLRDTKLTLFYAVLKKSLKKRKETKPKQREEVKMITGWVD